MTVAAGTAQTVTGQVEFPGISCPSTSSCEAVGGNSSTVNQAGSVDKVTISAGPAISFGTPQAVSGSALELTSIACPSTSTCLATQTSPSAQLTVVGGGPGGTPGATQVLNKGGPIACPSSTQCLVGGFGNVQVIQGGTPEGVNTVAGTGAYSGLSCPSVTVCVGAGLNTSGSSSFAVELAPTATSVSPSTTSPIVGQSVTYTATVAPVPEGGSVTFSDGGTPITCTGGTQGVDTTMGKATCTLTYSNASTTAHAITATYGGDPNYRSSGLSNTVHVTVLAASSWGVGADGAIYSFGQARYYGSMGGKPLVSPVVGLATTPDGAGYWEVAADGGIFNFGDAPYEGSMHGTPLAAPVVGIATAN